MVEAKASGIGICPNVNDPHPPSRGICTRTCRWTLSSSCLQVARKANQSSFVFVHNYRQTFVCWNERVPAWWINHRSRPTIRTFRNWVEESWWYSVCSLLLANIRLLYIFIIIVDTENKFHLRNSKYKIAGGFFNISIYWKRLGSVTWNFVIPLRYLMYAITFAHFGIRHRFASICQCHKILPHWRINLTWYGDEGRYLQEQVLR